MVNDVKFEVEAGFFDAINEDRTYSASDMNRPYKKLISNGVFATPQGKPSDYLQVFSAESGMNVVVSAGYALIGDKWFENPSDFMITLSKNTEILTRIDSIIAQIDKTQAGRAGNIVYRQGTASSNPTHPDINTDEDIIEFRLADITISPSCVSVTQDLIIDCRGSEECPWVTSLIYQVDTSTLYAQWQAAYKKYYEDQEAEHEQYFSEFKTMMSEFFNQEENDFNTWFEHMKDQLSEDAAGNLQLQINEIKIHKYSMTISTTSTAGTEIELPCYYEVGAGVIDVYLNGERLLLSSDETGTDGHYIEVGTSGEISNKIKSTSDWYFEAGDVLDLEVRGEYSET